MITKVCLAVGFFFPGAPQLDTKLHPILVTYCILSTLPLFHIMACILVSYYTSGLHDIKLHGLTAVAIVTICDTFYYLFRREEFNSLLKNFDKVTVEVISSNFVRHSDVKHLLNTTRKFNSYMKYYVGVVLFQTTCPTVVTYVLRYVFSRNFAFFEVPYSVQSEYVFHITHLLITSSGLYSCLKTVCSWSIMYLFLYHIAFYLKTLGIRLKYFVSTEERQKYYNFNVISETDNICILRSWIKLHQKILR